MSVAVARPVADRAAWVRDLTVDTLVAYGTPAEDRVEALRTEGIPDGDMPRLVVTTEEDLDGIEVAPPGFEVTCRLIVSAYAEHAQRADAIATVDTLVAQVREALLGDPTWVRSLSRITSVKVVRHWQTHAARIVAEAHTQFTTTWFERYPPRVPDVLTGIDTRIVRAPAAPLVLRTDFPPAP